MTEVLRLRGPTGLRFHAHTGWVWAFVCGVPIAGCHLRVFVGKVPNDQVILQCQCCTLAMVRDVWSQKLAELIAEARPLEVDANE